MRKILLLGSLVAACSIGLQEVSIGHGGTYRGPGDTVPPGGGGGGNGGGSSPGPNGPSGPGPGAPGTPGPGGPGAPGSSGGRGPTTGGGAVGPDLTLWNYWWDFNKDPYLNLKSHIHGVAPVTGSDDFFLGQGIQAQARDTLKPSEEMVRNQIVPALIQSLQNEDHNDILTGAMIALAKIGDDPKVEGPSVFEPLFLPFLKSGQQEVAETAAVALGILGNPESIETLKSILMDDARGRKLVGSEAGVNYRTRSFAAYGLGQIGAMSATPMQRADIVDTLWYVCESQRQSTRDLKVAAVISMGLVKLESAGPKAGNVDNYAGAPRDLEEQIEYLIDFFSNEKDKNKPYLVRSHAPRSICKLMEGLENRELKARVVKAFAPYLDKRVSKGERELRQSVALAFGQLGDLDGDADDEEIRTRLMDATTDADQQVKYFSLMAIGQVGSRVGTGQTPMEGVVELRKFLQTHLVRGKTQAKPWAGLAIGVMERGLKEAGGPSSHDSLSALRSSLKDTKTKLEVGAYAIACGIAGDSDAESILLDKLDNMSDDDVRGHISVGLGLMGSNSAIAPIQEVVAQSKYRGELLKQAAIALGLLGDQNLVNNLVNMLSEAKTLTTRSALAAALGFIGDRRSVDPLVKMLHDSSMTGAARGFAAVALGIVADKETLPWNSKFSVNINYRASTTSLTDGGTGLLDIL